MNRWGSGPQDCAVSWGAKLYGRDLWIYIKKNKPHASLESCLLGRFYCQSGATTTPSYSPCLTMMEPKFLFSTLILTSWGRAVSGIHRALSQYFLITDLSFSSTPILECTFLTYGHNLIPRCLDAPFSNPIQPNWKSYPVFFYSTSQLVETMTGFLSYQGPRWTRSLAM
jgi:hypothetical protein